MSLVNGYARKLSGLENKFQIGNRHGQRWPLGVYGLFGWTSIPEMEDSEIECG